MGVENLEFGEFQAQCLAVHELENQKTEAVRFFQRASADVKALRDVSLPEVEAAEGMVPDLIFRRARHVVSENARTTEAATQLGHHNYEDVGRLMGEAMQRIG